MIRAALIVEGKGDVRSIPDLIAKAAAAFDIVLIPSDPPIKAGEALKLKRPGELERHLYLACTRENVSAIYLVVDLDDGCAKEYAEEFNKRAEEYRKKFDKKIEFCFIVREYEVLFLNDLQTLKEKMPELGIPVDAEIKNPHLIRGAKEKFADLCKSKGYRQARDQNTVTKKLNPYKLGLSDRSFRKLVRCVTGMSYNDINRVCEEKLADVAVAES